MEWIVDQVSDHPVPYNMILEAMGSASAVLLPYRFGKSTAGRIPTKLYECLVLNKPFIVQKEPFLSKEFGASPLYHEVNYVASGSVKELEAVLNNLPKCIDQSLHEERNLAEYVWDEPQLLNAINHLF